MLLLLFNTLGLIRMVLQIRVLELVLLNIHILLRTFALALRGLDIQKGRTLWDMRSEAAVVAHVAAVV